MINRKEIEIVGDQLLIDFTSISKRYLEGRHTTPTPDREVEELMKRLEKCRGIGVCQKGITDQICVLETILTRSEKSCIRTEDLANHND